METWLITGASGQLGGHFLAALARDPVEKRVFAQSRTGSPRVMPSAGTIGLDLVSPLALAACIAELRPTHILHTAAMTGVNDCFANPDQAHSINSAATRTIAEAAQTCGARVVFTSTDMVFAGDAAPYSETDAPAPLSVYGRTKAAAERELVQFANTLTIRIPLLYGMPYNVRRTTFVAQVDALLSRQALKLFHDEHRTPLWLPDAAKALIALARSELTGVLHVAGPERLSRLELVERVAAALRIESPNIVPISRLSIESPEPRPADLSLDAAAFRAQFPDCVLHTIEEAVESERRIDR